MKQYKVTVTRKSNPIHPDVKPGPVETIIYAKDRDDAIKWAKKTYNVALSSIRASQLKSKK